MSLSTQSHKGHLAECQQHLQDMAEMPGSSREHGRQVTSACARGTWKCMVPVWLVHWKAQW